MDSRMWVGIMWVLNFCYGNNVKCKYVSNLFLNQRKLKEKKSEKIFASWIKTE